MALVEFPLLRFVSDLFANFMVIMVAIGPFAGPWALLQFLFLYTVYRTPCVGDQSVAMHLPAYRTI
jgi:hypothetical protein